ncbi:MAG: Hsp20/alpha crystallin family protein [Anaerolineae bacterium]|nr:Hsp20/alpha crystallin family protein [Anaerolineae bacterium]
MKALLPWNRGKSLAVRRESDPFLTLRREMNRLFDEFYANPFSLAPFESLWQSEGEFMPQIDISETDKEFTITADLPGIDDKDIEVSVSNNVISISGKKEAQKTEKGRNYYHVERSFGSFHRDIPLRMEIDEDKVEARFDKGVLTITAPKRPEAIENVKRVQVKKS